MKIGKRSVVAMVYQAGREIRMNRHNMENSLDSATIVYEE